MEGIICVTYRCNARCYMCNTWKFPTKPEEEIGVEEVEKLPAGLSFVNITGGEPFLHFDLLLEGTRVATELGIYVYLETSAAWCLDHLS